MPIYTRRIQFVVRQARSASTYHDPGAELAVWGEQVDVLAAHKVLRHANNGGLQTGVAVVVCGAGADDALENAHLKEKKTVQLKKRAVLDMLFCTDCHIKGNRAVVRKSSYNSPTRRE
jgi:hypothetical protein